MISRNEVAKLVGVLRGTKWYKLLLFVVLVLNYKSLPFAWHIRVFKPVFNIRLRHLLMNLRTSFIHPFDKRAQAVAREKWLMSIAPVGTNPFDLLTVYRTRVGLDDADYNGHLSNSSYPKLLDGARFKAALSWVPTYLRTGGIIALGGTDFMFIKEIPMFADFELRISLVGWDKKWLYVVGRFVTLPNKSKKSHSKKSHHSHNGGNPIPESFRGSIRQESSSDFSRDPTPSASSADLAALARAQLHKPEPDGATLHCLSMSILCFKMGRITVPPGVVFAAEGHSRPPAAGTNSSAQPKPYSHSNHPPHYVRPLSLWSPVRGQGGSTKRYRDWLKGGWREEKEQWWIDALGGEVEEKRAKNMEILKGLRGGMEGARSMYVK